MFCNPILNALPYGTCLLRKFHQTQMVSYRDFNTFWRRRMPTKRAMNNETRNIAEFA